MFVWDWVHEVRVTMNKMSKDINSACFSPDGKKLVTVGNQHLKYWSFTDDGEVIKAQAKDKEEAYIMEGKNYCNQKYASEIYLYI